MSSIEKYDYIFAGAGLAGLSLAYKIKKSPLLKDKRILLIDPSKKNKNDRTWCFWTTSDDSFSEILFKKWPAIAFHSDSVSKSYRIAPYEYRMIRGIDFYSYVLDFLQKQNDVDFVYEKIENIQSSSGKSTLSTTSKRFTADLVFKSYYENTDFGSEHFVWQHFKGWVIKTEADTFNPDEAVFMDFRVAQDGETRFFYVLPFNAREALVELAIFSPKIPPASYYDAFLANYIKTHVTEHNYTIKEEELGAIPMTTYDFNAKALDGVINIGTNGGSVKASSGYAFKRIQEETDRLLKHLENGKADMYRPKTTRFHFYDKILLNAILSHKTSGKEVFERLFKKLKPQTIFKFLDEKGSLLNDIKVFTAPPTMPFFKAFLEELRKKLI